MEINTRIKYLVALLCSVNLVQCDPVWDNINCFPQYPEDTPIGEWLFNLTATTSIPNDNLIFSAGNILTVDLVNLTEPWSSGTDKYTVGVVLIKELDRDFTPNPKLLQFDVKDSGDTVSRSCELIVLDVNDNAPIFRNLPYTPKVPEDISVGSVIFGNISVYDPDTSLGGTFTVAMKDDPNNAGVFTLNWTPGSGTASINLLSPLDYEQRNSFTIIIIATDGMGLVNTAEIIVTVEDVQDTPPYFLQPVYRAAIPEHSPPDSSVIKLYAEDGDRGIPREIRYRLVEGNSEFFRVEALTGMVYQKVSLDRDDDEMREINGVFDLVVQAYEVNALPPENATTNVTVTVTIEDINDNAPTFNTSTTYTAYVREDTPSDSLIYFDGEGYMRVFDLDQVNVVLSS
ncbi:hypothetical protein SNE40_019115 [Patella caerulea]|uniref:Cadherin domain-containing protein n=1 Tax=Patella caerulea TaxID=87958 RepID=A0AAN8J816_PATCE